jgi:hypothetical protein
MSLVVFISEIKRASDIKLVFNSSAITMMHGPINISYMFQFPRNRNVALLGVIH